MTGERPHSELYFGETRDLWWNLDQLARVFARAGLDRVERVLDVGAGVGHFSRVVSRALNRPVSVLGVEREKKWVAEATRLTQEMLDDGKLEGSFRFKQGTAEALPCEDEGFDLVMCQTVLIHLADPKAALREMRRVLKPGGFAVIAEPNNQSNLLSSLVRDGDDDIDAILRELRFKMVCEKGKAKLGLGFNSIGESMPRLLDECGFDFRDGIVCERLHPIVPPYLHPDEAAMIREMREYDALDAYCWEKDECRRYYEAGGGERFEGEWAFVRGRDRERIARVDRGEYSMTGASNHYLFVATKR
jgi:SAM-dependent methyltransferase